MPTDTNKMFSTPPEQLPEADVRAANTLFMAEKTNRPPSEINYDAEKATFFGADYSDNAAYYDAQKTTTGGQTDWGVQLDTALSGKPPEYDGSFWNDGFGERLKMGYEGGKAMAESITASAWDIVPGWLRGAGGSVEQITDLAPEDSKMRQLFDEFSENQFIQTMLATPRQFIDESGQINKEAQAELRRVSERGGKVNVAVNELTKAVVDTTTFLATMQLAGIQIGGTPKQSMNADVSRQMLSRLKSAGKLGAFRGVTSEADSLQERVDIASVTAMYMGTPAASGVFEGAKNVFVADLVLNSAITGPQVLDLWEREDIDDFDKILESIKMVGADLGFSAMTKTMRGNRLSPNWKPMAEASRQLIDAGKKTQWEVTKDIEALVAETDRLAEVNAPFADKNNIPKAGSLLNRIQGESDTSVKNGNGFIKVEQEKSNAAEDIRLFEEKLKALEKEVSETEPAKPAQKDGAEKVEPEKLDRNQRRTILNAINDSRDLLIDERVDAVNRAVQEAINSKQAPVEKDVFPPNPQLPVEKWFREMQDFAVKAKQSGMTEKQFVSDMEAEYLHHSATSADLKDIWKAAKIDAQRVARAVAAVEKKNLKPRVKRDTNVGAGVIKPKKMVVVDEYQALKSRLREINRTIKEGKVLGKAEARVAEAEKKAKLADIHKNAAEYVNTVVRGKDAKNALKLKIPNIKTVAGLDKFQREVNKAMAEDARVKAIGEAKDAVKSLKKTKLGTELRTVADEILAGIDSKGTSDKKMTELRNIKEFLESNGIEILPETAEKMAVLEKLRLKDMTTADLIDLKNVAKSVVHMQKQKQAMTKQGQDKIVEQKATEYVDEQRPDRMADSGLVDEKGDRIGPDPTSKGQQALAVKRTLDLTPNALLFYLDGGREGSAHDLYVKNIWKADDQRLRIEQEAHNYMEQFKDYIKGWDNSTAKDGYQTTLGGKKATISKSEKIAIYLDSLNAGNARHVREGGYVIDGKTVKPTPQEIDKIVSSVTETLAELQVASAIYSGYQNILRPAINETSNKVNGFDIANVDNYHPINTDRTGYTDKEATPATMREYTEILLDSSGHFSKRTGGMQAIKLQDSINKYDQMVKLVSRYNGYAEPIKLQKKFLDGKSVSGVSVRDTITKTYGKTYVKALENLTKDLEAGSSRVETMYGMAPVNKMIMHFGRGYLALNPSVAAGQPVSYLTAGNVIPFKYWKEGKVIDRMVPWDVMSEHSSLLWSRGKGHLDIAFGESADAKKLSKNMAMIRGMDHKAISQIWNASKAWVLDEKGFMDLKEVGKRVDDVVRRTQPTFETIDRPELARNPNFRVLSMFSSVINKNHALKFMNDVEAYEKIKRGEFTPEAKADWMRKSMLNRFLTPSVYAAIKTVTSVGFVSDLLEGENSFIKRSVNKFFDASIGEMGIISSKMGQFIKYIISDRVEMITGQEQNMPGTGELEDIGKGLIALGEFAARSDEDLGNWKTEKELAKDAEADKKMLQRFIRAGLATGGKGYQNAYDWAKIGYEAVTKEEESGLE